MLLGFSSFSGKFKLVCEGLNIWRWWWKAFGPFVYKKSDVSDISILDEKETSEYKRGWVKQKVILRGLALQ